jgi:hypothetical protein
VIAAPLPQVLIAGSELAIYGSERLYTALPSGRNWAIHDGLGSVRLPASNTESSSCYTYFH